LAGSLVFWVLYASSTGMITYYAQDITQYLRSSAVPNPYFYLDFSSLSGALSSSVVWYPTGHLQLVFPIFTTFFSVLLSVLFGLNVALAAYSVGVRRACKGSCSASLVSVIAALFVGGCCATPIGILLIGPLVSSPILFHFVYDYPIITNISITLMLLLSVRHAMRAVKNLGAPDI
jgi:hypothetical protein